MKKSKYLVSIAITSLLYSCDNKKVGIIEETEKDSIYSVYYYDDEANPVNGFSIEYYPNGKLKYHGMVRNKNLEGLQLYYYPNGSFETIANFKSGEKDGKIFRFYEDGTLESIEYNLRGKKVGAIKKFYRNGQCLEYSFIGYQGHTFYRERFDSLGRLLEFKQPYNLIDRLILTDFPDTVARVGDTLRHSFMIVNPPWAVLKVRQGELISKTEVNFNSKLESKKEDEVTFNTVFKTPGTKKMVIIAELNFSNNKNIIRDTFEFKCEVR